MTAPPPVQSVTTSSFTTNATSHAVAMPATVNAGDLLLMFFTVDSIPTITTPSGWSIVAPKTTTAGNSHCAIVYGKKADGTEGGTTVDVVTDTTEQAVAHVYRVTDWGGTLSTDVVAGTPSVASSTNNPNPPSVSWPWGTVDVLVIASEHHSENGDASAAPTNYTNLTVTNTSTGTAGAAVGSAWRAMTGATSPEDPGTFSYSTGAYKIANTVAVKAAQALPQRPILVKQAVQRSAVR